MSNENDVRNWVRARALRGTGAGPKKMLFRRGKSCGGKVSVETVTNHQPLTTGRCFRYKRNISLETVAACCLAVTIAFALRARLHRWDVTPAADSVFVSTRYITSIALTPDGAVWAGSLGGVLYRQPGGDWHRSTRTEGLPSHEVKNIRVEAGQVTASTPRGEAVWRDGGWHPSAAAATQPSVAEKPELPGRICSANWHESMYTSAPEGLYRKENGSWHPVAMPPSTGTHISALLPRGDTLWAALFGDGLWAYDGRTWQRVEIGLPSQAHEITAFAADSQSLWIGTRRDGLWERRDNRWKQHLQSPEPFDHNCQAITMYQGSLYVSTLEDGLVVRTPQGWGHVQSPVLSSNAPRQMVVFSESSTDEPTDSKQETPRVKQFAFNESRAANHEPRSSAFNELVYEKDPQGTNIRATNHESRTKEILYVRNGNSRVDRFDGVKWERDVWKSLPRREVSAIAADKDRLYAAQWGGWSEFDGKNWTHFLKLPDLQGCPVTALCPDGDRLWIGTQGRGLLEYVHSTGVLSRHDERKGLPDDWITALLCFGGRVYAGTFVGGLAVREGDHWTTLPELSRENVTALAADDSGALYVATRNGTWRQSPQGKLEQVQSTSVSPDPEAQALCPAPGGLWIGTRTGLFFMHR